MTDDGRKADAARKGEVELTLGDHPGRFRLPKCKTAGLLNHNPNKAELLLDTEGGHRFLIEMNSETAEKLYDLLERTFKSAHGR